MKKAIIYLMMFFGVAISAQEKVIEFTTTRWAIGDINIKSKVHFELYKDFLIMTYLDKKIVKRLAKKGVNPTTTFEYSFNKRQTNGGIEYSYQSDTEDFLIRTESDAIKPKPSVKISNKDSFSGVVTNSLYFSI